MYIVWSLLPVLLFLMALQSFFSQRFKEKKTDHTQFYMQQGVFCLLILVIAIGIDQTLFKYFISGEEPVINLNDQLLESIVNWFLYPALLVVAAILQGRFSKKEKK